MSLTAALLFNSPAPVFRGSVRQIVAKEMRKDLWASEVKQKTNVSNAFIRSVNRKAVLNVLSDGEKHSTCDIQKQSGLVKSTIQRNLDALESEGIVESFKPGTPHKSFFWLKVKA